MIIFAISGASLMTQPANAQQNLNWVRLVLTDRGHNYQFRIDETGNGTPVYVIQVTQTSDLTTTSFNFRGFYYRGHKDIKPKEPNAYGVVTVLGSGARMITTMRFTVDNSPTNAIVRLPGVTYEGAIRFIQSSGDGSSAFMAGTFYRPDSSGGHSDGPHPFTAKLLGWDMEWPR